MEYMNLSNTEIKTLQQFCARKSEFLNCKRKKKQWWHLNFLNSRKQEIADLNKIGVFSLTKKKILGKDVIGNGKVKHP